MKIIQILIAPNDSAWQGVLLGLGDDGATYHCKTGFWEPFVPALPLEQIEKEKINKKEQEA